MFDDLLPPLHDLDGFVATHVLGWQALRWLPAQRTYVGRAPDDAMETPVPRLTERDEWVHEVMAALRRLDFPVDTTPVPEGWRVQVGEAAVTNRSLPFALCAAAWRAWHTHRPQSEIQSGA
jgi:hypothetical protein